jgi:outer membrane immunogenic protein
MKRVGVGFLAFLSGLVVADKGFSADLPVAPPAAIYAPPRTYDWSGFYFGVYGGYGFGSTSWASSTFSTENFRTDGFLVGGTLGINYQVSRVVFGFEADGGWAGLKGSSGDSVCGLITAGAVCQTEQTWLATFRARLGFAVNRLLFFATAGGVTGDVQAGVNPPGTFDTTNGFGWTAGGGFEAALAENWTVKAEYLYVDLGNAACPTNCGALVPATVPLTENLIRAGINYRLPF